MSRAGMMARVSQDHSGDARSTSEQLEECRAWAADNDCEVVKEYEEVSKSASRFARKPREAWAELVADVTVPRYDVLIAWDTSRGSRKTADWITFLDVCRRKGVKIACVQHDRMYD